MPRSVVVAGHCQRLEWAVRLSQVGDSIDNLLKPLLTFAMAQVSCVLLLSSSNLCIPQSFMMPYDLCTDKP